MRRYIRKGIYSIEDVSREVGDRMCVFDGDSIRMGSMRYHTFVKDKFKCVYCGLQAQYFAKEKSHGSKIDSYHFNLYGTDESGKEVLFTKDHRVPKSAGGSDLLSNLFCTCEKCNNKKANMTHEEFVLLKGRT